MYNLVPKYYIVKKNILEQINKEEILPDQLIPSERMLMEQFAVSRITVRKAIEELFNEGYLYKVQGKGTYVKKDKNSGMLQNIASCSEEIRRQGYVPTRKVLSAAIIPSNEYYAHELQIKAGEPVFELKRIFYADGEPVNFSCTVVNAEYFMGIEKINFENESLYKILESYYGIKLQKANRYIDAVAAQGENTGYLNVPENYPILLFKGTTIAEVQGKVVPVEVFSTYYKTDKIKFYVAWLNQEK